MADVKKNVKKNTNKATKKPAVKRFTITSAGVGPHYEYKMSKESAYAITHDMDGKVVKEAKGRESDYLVEYVNEQCGLMGTCVAVIVG